jgi:hypothetical protein
MDGYFPAISAFPILADYAKIRRLNDAEAIAENAI